MGGGGRGHSNSRNQQSKNSISYDSLDHVYLRAFLFSILKKKNGKSEAKNLCVEVHWGGGGGVGGGGQGALQLKKDDNRFLFSGFRVFRIWG